MDAVLIPEVKFKIEDVHDHIWNVLQRKGHCVMCVAEGAGQEYVATGQKDSTGHDIYGDLGVQSQGVILVNSYKFKCEIM